MTIRLRNFICWIYHRKFLSKYFLWQQCWCAWYIYLYISIYYFTKIEHEKSTLKDAKEDLEKTIIKDIYKWLSNFHSHKNKSGSIIQICCRCQSSEITCSVKHIRAASVALFWCSFGVDQETDWVFFLFINLSANEKKQKTYNKTKWKEQSQAKQT